MRDKKHIAAYRKLGVLIFISWMILAGLLAFMWPEKAEAAERRWHLDEVQYQVSPECSRAIHSYVRSAVQSLSAHSVPFSKGGDDIYVSCEYISPFKNALSYLEPGTDSQVEEITLGTTKTTWYVGSLRMISAHIWIDPIYAPAFGHLEGVVYHEWLHALGMPHVDGGLMQWNSKLNHIDSATTIRLRQRYSRLKTSVIDSQGVYYISCLFVPKVLARLVGASEGFYDIQMKDNEIVDYEKVECATK